MKQRRCLYLMALVLILSATVTVAPVAAGNPEFGLPSFALVPGICEVTVANLHSGNVSPGNCFPLLHSVRIFPGTAMYGGIGGLSSSGGSLILQRVPGGKAFCSVAFSMIFEVPSPDLAGQLKVSYWTEGRDGNVRTLVLDPAGGDAVPLTCDWEGWQVESSLVCDLSAEALALRTKSQQLLEVLMVIEVMKCNEALKGVGGDAVAVTSVRLGPPPQPPE